MAAYLLMSRALAPILGHSGPACGLAVAAGMGVPAGLVSEGFDLFRPSVLLVGAFVAVQRWAGIGAICAAAAVATVRHSRKQPVAPTTAP